ncbi:hypothetical protein RA210_U480002 [Rubrivivax sp. A210]|nr:hypothetical protein RA210_U480002 [Rubrivivax sp. A210]
MVRGTFSPARAWRPTVGARLARTLGRTMATFQFPAADNPQRLHMRLAQTWLLVACLSVVSCGGNGVKGNTATEQTALEKAVAAARIQEATVVTLASPSPCTDSAQCKVLALEPTFNDPCNFKRNVLYSTSSATAQQAVQAANEYAELAKQARALSAPLTFGTSCGGVTMLQLYACVSSECVLQ